MEAGQTLVEFTLVIPVLMILLMAVLEMALALNASMAVNRASQKGAHVAATAGNLSAADCLIIEAIDESLGAPNEASRVTEVLIERSASTGDAVYARQDYLPGGTTECTFADGTTMEVPYHLGSGDYPPSDRCVALQGCPTLGADRQTVDNIGITVRYRHDWVTPLNGALDVIVPGITPSEGSGSGGWSFEQRNIFRMEPVL